MLFLEPVILLVSTNDSSRWTRVTKALETRLRRDWVYRHPTLRPPYKSTDPPTVSSGICSTRLALLRCFDCSWAMLISVGQIVCWVAIITNLSIKNEIFTDNAYTYLTIFNYIEPAVWKWNPWNTVWPFVTDQFKDKADVSVSLNKLRSLSACHVTPNPFSQALRDSRTQETRKRGRTGVR